MTEILGIVNVTPDSFSDGGEFAGVEATVAHGRQLLQDGATILDIGGESTRPGATRISQETEWQRISEVVSRLSAEAVVSVDTLNAATARAAVAAGAQLINDVSGGLADPEMFHAVAETGARVIIGHWRGIPDPENQRSDYVDVVREVRDHLASRVEAARAVGVKDAQIILDPGLGFDKTGEQCWELIARLDELQALGYPVLIGASRKRMLGEVLAELGHTDNRGAARDGLTSMVSLLGVQRGVWGVRVHDAAGTAQALAVHERSAHKGAYSAEKTSKNCGNRIPAQGVQSETQENVVAVPGSAQDRISLTGLEVFAHHGVFAEEKRNGQRFLIDAELTLDTEGAAAADDLAKTVNYAEVADLLAATAAGSHDLIETLAAELADAVLSSFKVAKVKITVHKPEAPIPHNFKDISVTVERRRDAQ